MRHILFTALFLFPVLGQAQDLILWRATNNSSPTVVPTYAGQISPFPLSEKKADVSDTTLTAEALAAQEARLSALQKAESILNGSAAFRPELAPIRIDGHIEGPAGPKVLILNQWVGNGRKLSVRLSRTSEVVNAINELRKYDSVIANELETELADRLRRKPFIHLSIEAIEPTQVKLKSEYGDYVVPILQSIY